MDDSKLKNVYMLTFGKKFVITPLCQTKIH